MSKGIEIINQSTANLTMANWKENWVACLSKIPVTADTLPSEVFKQNTPALSQIGKNEKTGQMWGIAIFSKAILDMVKFFGVSWEAEQIYDTANLAYQEYYWMTFAELKQFMTRIKLGKYKSNKNLSPSVLMEFLLEYTNEMHAERGKYFGKAKDPFIAPENPVTDEIFYGCVAIIANNLSIKAEKEKEVIVAKTDVKLSENLKRLKTMDELTIKSVEAMQSSGTLISDYLQKEYIKAKNRTYGSNDNN